jgi:hypothetical protein
MAMNSLDAFLLIVNIDTCGFDCQLKGSRIDFFAIPGQQSFTAQMDFYFHGKIGIKMQRLM